MAQIDVSMDAQLAETILEHAHADSIVRFENLQTLWSGYGQILRVHLEGGSAPSVIVKHVCPPTQASHPRGWSTDRSHQRKLRSYQVESAWYRDWSDQCDDRCRVPKSLTIKSDTQQIIFVMEDLDAAGFSQRRSDLDLAGVKRCVAWLANFHARFMQRSPTALWQIGTYWHLETRPDEWQVMEDGELKQKSQLIDQRLNECRYSTIVHGDAKVANFCFHRQEPQVAAVDFQYVGGGCGMKDLAYLMGSCLTERECESSEDEILDEYFAVLSRGLKQHAPSVDASEVEQEYRSLYCFAWADFDRFLAGWCPGHHKLNRYSGQQTRQALQQIAD